MLGRKRKQDEENDETAGSQSEEVQIDPEILEKAYNLDSLNAVKKEAATRFFVTYKDQAHILDLIKVSLEAKSAPSRNIIHGAITSVATTHPHCLRELIVHPEYGPIFEVSRQVRLDMRGCEHAVSIRDVEALCEAGHIRCLEIAIEICKNDTMILMNCLPFLLTASAKYPAINKTAVEMLSKANVGTNEIAIMRAEAGRRQGPDRPPYEIDEIFATLVKNNSESFGEDDLKILMKAGPRTAQVIITVMKNRGIVTGVLDAMDSQDMEIKTKAKIALMSTNTTDPKALAACIGDDNDINEWCLSQLSKLLNNIDARYAILSMVKDGDELLSKKAAEVLVNGPPCTDMSYLVESSLCGRDQKLYQSSLGIMGKICVSMKNSEQVRTKTAKAMMSVVVKSDGEVQKYASAVFSKVCGPMALNLLDYISSPNKAVRVTMLRSMGDNPPPAAVAAASRSAYPEVQKWALSKMRRTPEDLAMCASNLGGSDDTYKVSILEVYGADMLKYADDSGKNVFADPVVLLCRSQSPEVRAAALAAVAEVGFKAADQGVTAGLDDPDPAVRAAAVSASKTVLRDPAVVQKALDDPDPRVRSEGATLATIFETEESISVLQKLLRDDDAFVAYHSVTALGVMGDASSIGDMKALLKSKNPLVRAGAIRAIGLIGDPVAMELAADHASDESENVKRWALWTAAQTSSPAHLDEMFEYLGNLDPEDDDGKKSDKELCVDASIDDSPLLYAIAKYLERIGNRSRDENTTRAGNVSVAKALKAAVGRSSENFGTIVNSAVSPGFLEKKGNLSLGLSIPDPIELNIMQDVDGVLLENKNPFTVVISEVSTKTLDHIAVSYNETVSVPPHSSASVMMSVLSKSQGTLPVILHFSVSYLGVKEDQDITTSINVIDKNDTAVSVRRRSAPGDDNWMELYDDLGVIGIGGMAVVHKVVSKGDNKIYALKTPKDDVDGDQTRVEDTAATDRFIDEMKTWMEVTERKPRAAVRILKVGRAPSAWMLMELATESLADRLTRGIDIDEAVEISCKVLDSLYSIHEIGICHSDVKPANIMMVEGRWKLSDFGIANTTAAEGMLRYGTPMYSSPEQASGGEPTAESDVWQAAIMTYQLMTGRLPYGDDGDWSKNGTYEKVVKTGPDFSGIPEEYADVLRRATDKDPANRPSASDFRQDLDDVRSASRNGA